ncbi:MAG: nucleotidyltransferase family protein [Bacteroidaceae bacterium]|nr:nucleotidyltransferase family protein [Bacteroidaceae bacterium]
MKKEAVILAGGLGTRLRSVVADVPKCMASVAGKPFLYYLLDFLSQAGFEHVILSLGYKHEYIENWLKSYSSPMMISSVVETSPLGTGGGIRLALSKAREENVFILNGDTFLNVDYDGMLALHGKTHAKATLALKEMHNFDRYGAVEIDIESNRIIQFKEKKFCKSGLINGGTYLTHKDVLRSYPEKFSLEKDFFEEIISNSILTGYISRGYFIDIGIPDDYNKAQKDFGDGIYKNL